MEGIGPSHPKGARGCEGSLPMQSASKIFSRSLVERAAEKIKVTTFRCRLKPTCCFVLTQFQVF